MNGFTISQNPRILKKNKDPHGILYYYPQVKREELEQPAVGREEPDASLWLPAEIVFFTL